MAALPGWATGWLLPDTRDLAGEEGVDLIPWLAGALTPVIVDTDLFHHESQFPGGDVCSVSLLLEILGLRG